MKRQIPNILSVIRLLMIPVFVTVYFKYPDGNGVYAAAVIYIAAWATDVLDGYLARRNNWITEAGKILDPMADKLMQFSAAVCFTIDNQIFFILLIPLVIKELGMLVGSIIVAKSKKSVEPSHWFGKAATCVLFLCALTRIIIRGSETLDLILSITMLVSMLFALVMYARIFFKKDESTKR